MDEHHPPDRDEEQAAELEEELRRRSADVQREQLEREISGNLTPADEEMIDLREERLREKAMEEVSREVSEEMGSRYWVALVVDNSIPRPDPDPDTGFLPMYFNASPLLVPTDEGADALCVFSTEGKAIGYLREAEKQASVAPAMQLPLRPHREDFREFLAHYPVSYVAVDPEHGTTKDLSITVEDFLAGLGK